MFRALGRFIAKGRTVMAVYSYAMIALSAYSIAWRVPIDGSVAAMYSIAVAFYGGSRMQETYETNRARKLASERDPEGGYA